MTPPFFQLGRRIAFVVWAGDHTVEVSGEIMDTDAGWIAVREDQSGTVAWFNLDHVTRIVVMEHVPHD